MLKKVLKKLELKTDQENFIKLREEAFNLGRHYVKDKGRVFDFLLCTEEIYSNSYMHAYESNGTIEISFFIEGNFIGVSIKDLGVGISDEYIYEELKIKDETAESGRGLFIVKSLSDKMNINKNKDRGTEVIFYFERI
ncbi:MAG: ATP-binding protein [Peptostreptococcaceae bacterium]|jgi:anti-sigma regulatory factor (Ser/Thr protein kinase)|nr:ATP-binding protein [Peptostreptococcaceae bacterium]